MSDPAPELFPRPRRITLTGGPGAPVDAPVTFTADHALGPEAFTIDVAADGIAVAHGGPQAQRYAEQAVVQLRTNASGAIPALRIEDEPDFPVRGYMLDISRDRVPTLETLARLIELMALCRINHFELYTEHTFAYRDHEVVWADASPMTPDDIAWIQDRCDEAGIELVPNQNCFGHMGRWLVHDAYRGRAEAPDGFDFLPGMHMAPSTFAPNPDNAAFAVALFDELLPNFRSRTVNIGCDEPFELGKGVSTAEVAARGKEIVYLDHVRRIIGPLVERGYEVLMWADVLRNDPSAIEQLPPGTIPIAWSYEAPPSPDRPAFELPPPVAAMLAEAGVDIDSHRGFAANVAPLAAAGIPFWVAPGTSAWNSLVGRVDNAIGNLLDAAEVGSANDARGYLITDWGDNGHVHPPSVSFGPIVFGGAVSWCVDSNRGLDLATILDEHVFLDPTRMLGAALMDLGTVWRATGKRTFNASPLHDAVVAGAGGMGMGKADPDQLAAAVARIEAAAAAIDASAPACSDASLVKDELAVAAGWARHAARRLLGEQDADEQAELVERQRAAWLARSRPGGLADSIARLAPKAST